MGYTPLNSTILLSLTVFECLDIFLTKNISRVSTDLTLVKGEAEHRTYCCLLQSHVEVFLFKYENDYKILIT